MNSSPPMPVRRVLVMEDRAQVERSATVALTAATTVLEIPGITPSAVDRSLRVEATGASLVDARLVRRWRAKPKGGLDADASALRRRLKALDEACERWDDERRRLAVSRRQLATARADVLRAIAEQAGAGIARREAWSEALALLDGRGRTLAQATLAADANAAAAARERARAREAADEADRPVDELECALVVTVEGAPGAEVRLCAQYLVPCAVWRPSYRATLRAGSVRLETEAVVWQRTGEAWDDVELTFSTARPTLGTSPPRIVPDRLSTQPKPERERRAVEVSVREAVIAVAAEAPARTSDELPGLDDGGEARVLAAPSRQRIPSDGQPHRVPLSAFEAPAEVECLCVPELSPVASTVARFANAGGQVLLAGPVDLVREAGFVGRSRLAFASPGERIRLSFGSDDALRVVRSVDERQDEARLTGRRTTTRTVSLFVSNAGSTAATLFVDERVPVSELKDVEVRVLTKACEPPPESVSPDGIVRFHVSVPARGTYTVKHCWELQAAAKVVGL